MFPEGELGLVERIRKLASRNTRIAMGVGVGQEPEVEKCVQASERAWELGYGRVTLVGVVSRDFRGERIQTEEPEKTLVELSSSGETDAVIRGTAKAGLMLKLLKEKLKLEKTLRVALLQASDGHSFFFAPVGVDEGESLKEKLEFVAAARDLLRSLNVEPKVAVLSGGRLEDLGRSQFVDKSLAEGGLVTSMSRQTLQLDTEHYGILVEDAVRQGANFILAPDGVSGNLLYRTLVHLGSGKSHGALYVGVGRVIVDTSRSAPVEEYLNATALASAFVSIRRKVGEV